MIHYVHTSSRYSTQDHREANDTRPLIPLSLIFGLIKGNKCSIHRIFEISDCFLSHFVTDILLYSRLRFVVKAIIVKFLDD